MKEAAEKPGVFLEERIEALRGEHDDVDVSILASDVPALREHVGDRWHLWNLAGGDMRPLTPQHPNVFNPASQLWVREHGDAPWVLDLPLTPDRDGLWTNKFVPDQVGAIDEVTWVADDGIRYLNPEIVLLFKARKRRAKDEWDFARAWPMLAEGKQNWLRGMIGGHPRTFDFRIGSGSARITMVSFSGSVILQRAGSSNR